MGKRGIAMRRSTAAVGSAVFFLLAPGVVVGLIPWWLTGGWQVREPLPYWAPMRPLGGVLLVAGLIALVRAFARFVVEGLGTPAPVAAPERLVVGGAYRYVRNPMYVAVLTAIVGQSLLLGRLGLVLYAGVVWAAVAMFVRFYEEPTLARRFGADYEAYRRGARLVASPAPLGTRRARRTRRRLMSLSPSSASRRAPKLRELLRTP
jgi:protein-S-isoprenylcysteine O-methyltransferase Ste14